MPLKAGGVKRSRLYTSLKLKKNIDRLFAKEGRKIFEKNLMLRYYRSKSVNPPFQVVFAVSQRLGDAHQRNRIKRRLREALLAVLQEGRITKHGFELAILPKKDVADLPFLRLCDEVRRALSKLP